MNKNLLYLMIIVISTILLSCQKDIVDNPETVTNTRERTTTANHCDIFLSYNKETKSYLSTKEESSAEDCIHDIMSSQVETINQLISSCMIENQLLCQTIENINSRNTRRDSESLKVKKIESCQGSTTITMENGETSTSQTALNTTITSYMLYAALGSEVHIDSMMSIMIEGLNEEGLSYEIDNNYLTITEIDEDGSTYTTLYDIENGVLIGESIIDVDGNLIYQHTNFFTCTDDGRLVLDISKTIEQLETYYCDQSLIKNTISKYTNQTIQSNL